MTVLHFAPLPAVKVAPAPNDPEFHNLEDVEPIPFFPDDLPDLDMKAGGWEKDEIRTALIVARRQLHVDTSTLADSLSNV